MNTLPLNTRDTGLEVYDLFTDPGFSARQLHERDVATQMEGMRRLTRAFVENPDNILQELVNSAVELCDADSAGISLERDDPTDDCFYQWVATAGAYAPFLNAMLPRFPSACGLTLERSRPQLFRVSQRFFDLMRVEAPVVTDGILLPWQIDQTRGTIWIMAHGRSQAFDSEDCRMMQVLADFAAMATRHQRQQRLVLEQASRAAAADMANQLAHEINNPLQSLTNLVYLASQDRSSETAQQLGLTLAADIQRLSSLVQKLLSLPSRTEKNPPRTS